MRPSFTKHLDENYRGLTLFDCIRVDHTPEELSEWFKAELRNELPFTTGEKKPFETIPVLHREFGLAGFDWWMKEESERFDGGEQRFNSPYAYIEYQTSKYGSSMLKDNRCLLLASGWVIREQIGEHEGLSAFFDKPKGTPIVQKTSIIRKDKAPFAMAGLSRWWGGDNISTACTVITTKLETKIKNRRGYSLRPPHQQVPIIISPDSYGAWLDVRSTEEEILSLLRKESRSYYDFMTNVESYEVRRPS